MMVIVNIKGRDESRLYFLLMVYREFYVYFLKYFNTLVNFWVVYNLLLVYLIENIPSAFESALYNIGKDEPVTLKFVVEEYVRHLQHHLDDIVNS